MFKFIFVIGLIAQEVIRFPYRMRNKQDRKAGRFVDDRSAGVELVLSLVALVGLDVIPLFYALTNWLDSADYGLPTGLGWLGIVCLIASLWMLHRAHVDLGRNWSPTLQVTQNHKLVTGGVYRYLRHPIYASVWLGAIAQCLMLPNWIAGWSGIVAALLVQFIRVPREEQMMVEHFGEAYREYARQTGGVVPRTILGILPSRQ